MCLLFPPLHPFFFLISFSFAISLSSPSILYFTPPITPRTSPPTMTTFPTFLPISLLEFLFIIFSVVYTMLTDIDNQFCTTGRFYSPFIRDLSVGERFYFTNALPPGKDNDFHFLLVKRTCFYDLFNIAPIRPI